MIQKIESKVILLSLSISSFCFILLTACSTNLYEGVSNKTSNEALYEDAINLLDSGDYDESIAKFNDMSPDFSSTTTVREKWAGALAGKCGFNFINYFNYLSATVSGSPTFFQYLMNPWVGTATSPDYCRQAEAKIKEIWAEEAATSSQQLFMAILSIAKMGSYTRYVADNNVTNGDGTKDAEFNSCDNTTGGPDQMTDAEVKELVTGLSLFLQNITSFAASLGGISSFTAAVNLACAAMTPNPCTTTDSANVTAPMVNSMRDLLDSAGVGLGVCVTGAACCP